MTAETFTVSVSITDDMAMIRPVWGFFRRIRSSVVSWSHLESKKNVCQLERAEDTTPVFNTDSKLAKYVYNQAK